MQEIEGDEAIPLGAERRPQRHEVAVTVRPKDHGLAVEVALSTGRARTASAIRGAFLVGLHFPRGPCGKKATPGEKIRRTIGAAFSNC